MTTNPTTTAPRITLYAFALLLGRAIATLDTIVVSAATMPPTAVIPGIGLVEIAHIRDAARAAFPAYARGDLDDAASAACDILTPGWADFRPTSRDEILREGRRFIAWLDQHATA